MTIAELMVRVRGDTSDASQKMKGLQQSFGGLETAAKRLAGVMSVGFFGRAVLQNTVEAQNAIAQLGAVVKSTGGAAGFTAPHLAAMAGELQKVSTFSDEAIMGAQGLLLTFTKIRGDTLTGATKAVLDLATAMGGDLQGAAVQVGKALNDPTQGMTALRRVGVSFSASQVDVIKKLQETGRLAEAQALILKELQTEFGGSAQAARNTLGGALKALQNAFGDALEASTGASSGIVGAINAMADVIPGVRAKFDAFFGGISLLALDASINLQKFLNVFRSAKDKVSDSDLEALRSEGTREILGLDQPNAGSGQSKTAPIVPDVKPVKELKVGFDALRNAAESVNKELEREKTDWWKGYIDRTNQALTLTEELARQVNSLRPSLTDSLEGMTAVPKADISADVKVANDQAKKINDAAKEHAEMLASTISSTASQIASVVASAIGTFGNSRGNAIGGAVGGGIGGLIGKELTTAGGAFIGGKLGAAVGSVIPVVGTIVGGFIGSALGGLFGSHKKEVSANTQAIRQNTAMLGQLFNAPSGFKIAGYHDRATDVRAMITAGQRWRARGGAPLSGAGGGLL